MFADWVMGYRLEDLLRDPAELTCDMNLPHPAARYLSTPQLQFVLWTCLVSSRALGGPSQRGLDGQDGGPVLDVTSQVEGC